MNLLREDNCNSLCFLFSPSASLDVGFLCDPQNYNALLLFTTLHVHNSRTRYCEYDMDIAEKFTHPSAKGRPRWKIGSIIWTMQLPYIGTGTVSVAAPEHEGRPSRPYISRPLSAILPRDINHKSRRLEIKLCCRRKILSLVSALIPWLSY